MFVSAGNPVLSVPNGDELEEALDAPRVGRSASTSMSTKRSRTVTTCCRPATMYERDDFPLLFQTLQPTPFRQATEAVVEPLAEARAEGER